MMNQNTYILYEIVYLVYLVHIQIESKAIDNVGVLK